jgi:hypothetical protein
VVARRRRQTAGGLLLGGRGEGRERSRAGVPSLQCNGTVARRGEAGYFKVGDGIWTRMRRWVAPVFLSNPDLGDKS